MLFIRTKDAITIILCFTESNLILASPSMNFKNVPLLEKYTNLIKMASNQH